MAEQITIDKDKIERIIKKFATTEAWAAGLQEECRKTREELMQAAGMSIPANGQRKVVAMDAKNITRILAKRRIHLQKQNSQCANTGHL